MKVYILCKITSWAKKKCTFYIHDKEKIPVKRAVWVGLAVLGELHFSGGGGVCQDA